MNTQPIDGMIVSRELLERIAQPLIDADSRYEQFQAMLALRVMLRENPAAQTHGEPVAVEKLSIHSTNDGLDAYRGKASD